ncbi:acyltransferase family protein [Alistipes ihumii]|uniref:acyltransferase family protein n=1 Tax=Alistipes ihumii TaxID=1470347 RepID=UPI002595699B|nr:acyltransferase [uncultured Alistipes sp.]
MIRSFTGWRYIFAVAIFMHHYQIDGKSVLQAGGAIGVTFFFILSGFLLAYGYKKRLMTREISTSDFYKARAVKLYPLHILCFAAVFLLGIRNFVTADLPKAVLNLFLLQSWVPSPDYYMSYNAVSWFLSDELFFYLMFPFVLPVLLNGSGKKIAVGAGIFAISYSAFWYSGYSISGDRRRSDIPLEPKREPFFWFSRHLSCSTISPNRITIVPSSFGDLLQC